MLPERLPVHVRAVAHVLGESVLGILGRQSPHQPVAHHFGHHRGRGDRGALVVGPDDRAGAQIGTSQIEPVHHRQAVFVLQRLQRAPQRSQIADDGGLPGQWCRENRPPRKPERQKRECAGTRSPWPRDSGASNRSGPREPGRGRSRSRAPPRRPPTDRPDTLARPRRRRLPEDRRFPQSRPLPPGGSCRIERDRTHRLFLRPAAHQPSLRPVRARRDRPAANRWRRLLR